ncbi:hypothetical protein GH714_014277 [Hevea brasiliensis]|uniref:Reverse transcriptase RNase H-like domain-containing protein n=1 Tax=Hevea brasiliensis TaxID=3981 RepID=A0A6A6LSX7_HEVBR|nr:hypothetical protein GH714_014277 [Hevea brasiliensis]
MSRALGPSKQAWSTYAKEMLAILQAIRTWRPYILGRKFFIQTDQRSLKYLVEQRVVTPEQQNWVSKLLGYDYEILYKPGKENRVADALSRVSGIPSLNSLFLPHSSLWDRIKATLTTDPYMLRIGQLASDRPGQPYIWKNGLIFFKNRVVIPPQCLEQYLRCFASQQPRKWCSFLPWAEYWYNTSFHISIGMTPFLALYGRNPPMIPRTGRAIVEAVHKRVACLEAIIGLIDANGVNLRPIDADG